MDHDDFHLRRQGSEAACDRILPLPPPADGGEALRPAKSLLQPHEKKDLAVGKDGLDEADAAAPLKEADRPCQDRHAGEKEEWFRCLQADALTLPGGRNDYGNTAHFEIGGGQPPPLVIA